MKKRHLVCLLLAVSVRALAAQAPQRNAAFYYNDQANNCTCSVGVLAHVGPCTPEELGRTLDAAQADAVLAPGIDKAEVMVRRMVTQRRLTQAQFNGLVSYAYNAGKSARAALEAANRGDDAAVVKLMNQNVYYYPRDRRGHRLQPLSSLAASGYAFAPRAVIQNIATRSGRSLGEIQATLANCDASQQNMYFCAWRDVDAAERELQQTVGQQINEHPAHKAALEAQIARWKEMRDATCQNSARDNFGGGSMEPTDNLVCVASMTYDMAKAMKKSPFVMPQK